jgi:hypothetical protein
VQREDIGKILAGANDGADDGFPAEHRVEDRDGHLCQKIGMVIFVISGQPATDEPAAAAK